MNEAIAMNYSNVARLGRTILERMGPADSGQPAFCQIAHDTLAEARLRGDVDLAELVAHAVDLPGGAPRSRNWAAPVEVPLFRSDEFMIELRMWHDGDVRVREQDWRGAYTILSGGGVATRYRFEETRRVCDKLRTGRLVPLSCDLVVAGDVRVAEGGVEAPIEHLMPVGSPTAALVVRTLELPESAAALTHYRPSIAIAAANGSVDRLTGEARKCAVLGSKLGVEALLDTVKAAVRRLDRFRGAYIVLSTPVRTAPARARFLDEVPPLFGDLEDDVRASLRWNWAVMDCEDARLQVADPDVRFALATYASAPDSEALQGVVQASNAGVAPFDLLVRGLSALIDDGQLSVLWDPDGPEEGLLRAFLRGDSVHEATQSRSVDANALEGHDTVREAFALMTDDPVLRCARVLATRLD